MKPVFKNIPVNKIDPPFQKRNYFDADKLDRQSKVFRKKSVAVAQICATAGKKFKKLPKRLEWKSFYVHDFPLVREICEDIRKISLENQLNKSQIKDISEVKKISQEAYQHIVNNTQTSDTPKIENNNQGEKTASIFPLRDMSAREIMMLLLAIKKK
jgi:hypothetical protein